MHQGIEPTKSTLHTNTQCGVPTLTQYLAKPSSPASCASNSLPSLSSSSTTGLILSISSAKLCFTMRGRALSSSQSSTIAGTSLGNPREIKRLYAFSMICVRPASTAFRSFMACFSDNGSSSLLIPRSGRSTRPGAKSSGIASSSRTRRISRGGRTRR
jgi:hypothetical protein